MARRTKIVTIDTEGRDKDKTFEITELSAEEAEEWGFRFVFGLGRAGVDIPEEVSQMGFAAITFLGVHMISKMAWSDAKPLLDVMMGCVRAIPDPVKNPGFSRALVPSDTEEVRTRLRLRDEVLELHTGFSVAAALSSLTGIASGTAANQSGLTTVMSEEASEPLSPPARPH